MYAMDQQYYLHQVDPNENLAMTLNASNMLQDLETKVCSVRKKKQNKTFSRTNRFIFSLFLIFNLRSTNLLFSIETISIYKT